jgi:Asp-tRNA(Asn)/Glu-tRNA(Gln) amidotransferase A subunit family amidase
MSSATPATPAAHADPAGAVPLGKTNTPEFGCEGETNSPLNGITRKPWSTARTAGGASGGGTAAVATGLLTGLAGGVRSPRIACSPTRPGPAFQARDAGSVPMNAEAMLGWTPFSYPFNLTQQPACTLPCGFTGDGLPIRLQLVGPMFDDALVLRAARAYETTRPIARAPLPGA